MKKLLFFSVLLLGATLIPQNLRAQTTEGTEFYATFLQADHRDDEDKSITLSLIASARTDCNVTIDNKYFRNVYINVKIDGVADTKTFPFVVPITANKATEIQLYTGTAQSSSSSNDFCYTRNNQVKDSSVLHVTATAPISLFASNYKSASFDAANVLPKDALQKNYLIQCFTPSDHKSKPQGSHFAIVAVKDNTVAKYVPSVSIPGYAAHDTVTTDTLKAGQVWYVWTDDGDGHSYDLSGTSVSANEPIAVFQGNPHTNLPYNGDFGISGAIQQRDHLFSQAMPINTWGNTFAVTRSARKRDVLRIMAIDDGTEVKINGVLKHTFNFATEPQQYWEIQIGDAITNGGKSGNETRPAAEIAGSSCLIETSCPCAVHLFIVSQEWDGKRGANDGDPAMLWINPIEQKIDQITFSTYASKNEKGDNTSHYVNIVTDKKNVIPTNKMKIMGGSYTSATDITGWQHVVGSDNNGDGNYKYYYVKKTLDPTPVNGQAQSYTLTLEDAKSGDGFIAYVYGFTSNESYGYNAGGAAKPLGADVTINGDTLKKGQTTQICRSSLGSNEIKFTCTPDTDHAYTRITWDFGDGTPLIYGHKTTIESGPLPANTTGTSIEALNHTYAKDSVYKASVKLERTGSTACSNIDTAQVFPMEVVLEALHITTMPVKDHLCSNTASFRIYYETKEDLKKQNPDGSRKVDIQYTPEAKSAGFDENIDLDKFLKVDEDNRTYFNIEMPTDTVLDGAQYGIKFTYKTKCDTTDTIVPFTINYTSGSILAQRWENAIAVWTPEEMLKHIKNTDKTHNWNQKSIHFNNYAWFQRDTTGTSRDYTWMPAETESFLLRERVPENHEFYVDIYYSVYDSATNTFSQDTISSCPIAFAKTSAPDMFEADSAIIELGDIVVYRADRNYMLVMSAQDGEAKWINSQGSTVASADVRAGGSMVALPPENGLYILRVIVGKNKKNMKVMVY